MAVPPVVAAQLAKLGVEEAKKLRSTARRIGETFADQFGLTADHEYIGWKLLMIIAFELYENKLKAPLQAAWVIEQQVSGVLEQIYKFYGGELTAAEAGLNNIGNALGKVVPDVAAGFEWLIHL